MKMRDTRFGARQILLECTNTVAFPGHNFWEGSVKSGTGIPQLWIDGRNKPLPRLIYTHLVGEIPEKHRVYNLCGIKRCLTPSHLIVKRIEVTPKVERTPLANPNPNIPEIPRARRVSSFSEPKYLVSNSAYWGVADLSLETLKSAMPLLRTPDETGIYATYPVRV